MAVFSRSAEVRWTGDVTHGSGEAVGDKRRVYRAGQPSASIA